MISGSGDGRTIWIGYYQDITDQVGNIDEARVSTGHYQALIHIDQNAPAEEVDIELEVPKTQQGDTASDAFIQILNEEKVKNALHSLRLILSNHAFLIMTYPRLQHYC